MVRWHFVMAVMCLTWSQVIHAADEVSRPIRTMLHGGMTAELPSEEYLRFVEEIKPDVLVMGVFDQRLYAMAAPGAGKGKVAAPKSPQDVLAAWKKVTERLHRSGIRLVGHMEVNVVTDRPADRDESLGWFGFYDQQWESGKLGVRPTNKAHELLEEPDLDAHADPTAATDDTAKCGCRVNLKALNSCINKPGWREVQKQMVRQAVAIGVDGFITNRNYFGHCACADCRGKFAQWLRERYTPEQLKSRFGISDLKRQPPSCVVGMHRQHETVPDELTLEKQRFIKHMMKEFIDEVYIEQGRKLDPHLIVSQWNHMAYFDELHLDRGHLPLSTRTSFAHGAADERWGLPLELWGRGESLLWYCNWGTTQNTILDKQYNGDTVLYGKLLRTMAAGKPYVINKYDFYRPRNMMAEAGALGYATNAVFTSWQTEEDRDVARKYFSFLKQQAGWSHGAESYAEVGLVFPRRALHAADAAPLEYVEAAGRKMVEEHVLFDMLPDDGLTRLPLKPYRAVVLCAAEYLEPAERDAVAKYLAAGGKVLYLAVNKEDRTRPGAAGTRAKAWPVKRDCPWQEGVVVQQGRTDRERLFAELLQSLGGKDQTSHFAGPRTVEVHAYRQPGRGVAVHFVNYHHNEKGVGKAVSAREAPIATEPLRMRLRLPGDVRAVRGVRFASPDEAGERRLEFRQAGGFLEVTVPAFLVYGLCVVEEG